MKVIVSHDVDHLNLLEHWRDRFYPGLLFKGFRGVVGGSLTASEFVRRATCMKLENLNELNDFNTSHGIRATYFFGMDNALSLSYHYSKAKPFMDFLLNENNYVGLHGINYDSKKGLEKEFNRFKLLLNSNQKVGIRNHYLRKNESTHAYMDELGFCYDSTFNVIRNPWKIGGLWEIPITVMDADILSPLGGKIKSAKAETLRRLDQAEKMGLKYFVINFHDVYFSSAYSEYKGWYTWLIDLLRSNHIEFISFNQAVKELEQ